MSILVVPGEPYIGLTLRPRDLRDLETRVPSAARVLLRARGFLNCVDPIGSVSIANLEYSETCISGHLNKAVTST